MSCTGPGAAALSPTEAGPSYEGLLAGCPLFLRHLPDASVCVAAGVLRGAGPGKADAVCDLTGEPDGVLDWRISLDRVARYATRCKGGGRSGQALQDAGGVKAVGRALRGEFCHPCGVFPRVEPSALLKETSPVCGGFTNSPGKGLYAVRKPQTPMEHSRGGFARQSRRHVDPESVDCSAQAPLIRRRLHVCPLCRECPGRPWRLVEPGRCPYLRTNIAAMGHAGRSLQSSADRHLEDAH